MNFLLFALASFLAIFSTATAQMTTVIQLNPVPAPEPVASTLSSIIIGEPPATNYPGLPKPIHPEPPEWQDFDIDLTRYSSETCDASSALSKDSHHPKCLGKAQHISGVDGNCHNSKHGKPFASFSYKWAPALPCSPLGSRPDPTKDGGATDYKEDLHCDLRLWSQPDCEVGTELGSVPVNNWEAIESCHPVMDQQMNFAWAKSFQLHCVTDAYWKGHDPSK